MAPRLVTAQAAGPRSVRVPPPVAKVGAAKPKTDRTGLPPVPKFKDVAKEVGLTAVHISAPEAHYVIDSTSGGVGLLGFRAYGRFSQVLVYGCPLVRICVGGA